MSLIDEDSVPVVATSILRSWTHPFIAGGVAAASAIIFLSLRLAWSPTHKHGVPLPPGPAARWFWENPLPKQDIARTLAALIDQYGPVVSLRSGRHVTIVIGRMDAATEIMEKEGSALVDRPRMIAAGEILSQGMRLIFARAGERFRRLRRAAHTHLQPKAAELYEEIQSDAAKGVILDILNDPGHHIQHVRRYAVVVSLRVMYGKTTPTASDDPEVERLHQVVKNFETVVRPGAYLVDRVPWLKYMPGYGRQLQKFRQYELALFRKQLDQVKHNIAANSTGPSFARTLLENTDDHQLSDDEMAYLTGSIYGAGSDTTAAAITVMIMAAACNPDAQARVQEELDEAVGKGRIPTFEDREMLPQLHAFMLEALRWRPIAPLGFAHRAMRDIIWRGQCIPAGATVFGYHWAISRDPEVFPDPEAFNPQRWASDDEQIGTDIHFHTYGFGRRTCPGQHVANRSLYINLAYLLWSFRILQRPEAPIVHDASGFRNPIVFRPAPFEVEFVTRVEERRLRELMV